MTSLGRILIAINGGIFILLLGWMTLTYTSASTTDRTTVVPASSPEGEVRADRELESNEWDELATTELSAEDRSDDHPLQKRGLEAFEAGRVGEAIGLLSAAAEVRPMDASIWNDLGVYLARAGRHDESILAFSKALAGEGNEARAHYNLGTAQLRAGHPDEAIPELARALEINPFYGEARYNLAQAWTRLGNNEAAKLAYAQIVEVNRTRIGATAQNNLGILLRREGEPRKALDHFTAALRRFPDLTTARFNKALVLAQLGREAESRTEYEKLIEVDPRHVGAHVNLAAVLMRDENWAAAAEHLRQAIRVDPDYARAHYNLGLCQARLGDDEGAVNALNSALEASPDYAAAAYNLALAERRRGNLGEAARWFGYAADIKPLEPEYHYNLGLVLAGQGSSDQAARAYKAALALRPGYFRAQYNLGLVLYRAELYEEALAAFEAARVLRADSYEAVYNLGLTHLKLLDPAAAEITFERAIELDNRVSAHYNLGLALSRQDRPDDAARAYRSALLVDPKHARSLERLAEVHSSKGRHAEAQVLLQRLQLLDPTDPSAYNAGLRAYRTSNFRDAILYLEVAATGSTGLRARSLNMIGLAHANDGRLQQGTQLLGKAVDEFPDNERIRRNYRIVRARQARLEAQ